MKKEIQSIIKSDMHRYYEKVPFFIPIQVRYQLAWRKAGYYPQKSFRGIYYRLCLKHLSEKSGIQIPTRTKIGKGFTSDILERLL